MDASSDNDGLQPCCAQGRLVVGEAAALSAKALFEP